MVIWVNQKQYVVEKESVSVQQLINQLQISTQGIAVAVNNRIITRSKWDDFQLKENDNILIITATQGG